MRQALLVIDMLNDFVLAGAPLEVPHTREILPAIQRRIADARKEGIPVIYLCDAHAADDREFSRMDWPPHAVAGTPGAEIVAELSPLDGDEVVAKTTYSGFHATRLQTLLEQLKVEELVLTGCVTSICVLYTAADAVMRGFHVRVPTHCIAHLDPADGVFALGQMKNVLGVELED